MNNINFTQIIKHNLRALKIIHELLPGSMSWSIFKTVAQSLQPLLTLYFSSRVIDELAGAKDPRRIALFVMLAISLSLVLSVFQTVMNRRLSMLNDESWIRCRQHRTANFAHIDFSYTEESRVKDMLADLNIKELTNSFGLLKLYWVFPNLVGSLLSDLTATVILGGIFTASSGAFTLWIALLLAASIILPYVANSALGKRATAIIQEGNRQLQKGNSFFAYILGSGYTDPSGAAKDIRIFGQQPAIMEIFGASFLSLKIVKIYARATIPQNSVSNGLNAVLSGAAYVLLGLGALAGRYSIGELTRSVGALKAFSDAVASLVTNTIELRENTIHLAALFEFIDLPSRKYQGTLSTEKRSDNEYQIEFHHVSFKYPGSDIWAIKDLSLTFNIGHKLAVVGMNGSGKTTMIKLLCRLYEPSEGEITLNNIDIKKYDYEEYLAIFSVVFQDFKLFGFPLGQNVAVALDYDREKAARCLALTGFSGKGQKDHITLDTALYKDYDEAGVAPSGGEAQKIALARSLYREAAFIILDEPTAALDPLAESEIYAKFDRIVGGRTAVYISHRLSSCRFCDDIAVFHEGCLVQRGNHETLLADTGGKYAELWNAQAQYYQ